MFPPVGIIDNIRVISQHCFPKMAGQLNKELAEMPPLILFCVCFEVCQQGGYQVQANEQQ